MLALLFALFTTPGEAAPQARYSTEFAPQYRILNQEGLSDEDELFEGFARLDAHFELTYGSWMFEAKPEVRAVFSRGVNESAPEGVSVRTSRRGLNASRMLWSEEDSEAYFDFDRLNARYSFMGGEVFAGRRPISLGVLRFFPVWNKLTLPLIFQPGPEWIENPDGAGASVQIGRFSYRAFWARGNEPRQDELALFESRFFGDGVELQALAGYWWEHGAVGLAGAFDAFSSTLRLETLWIGRHEDNSSQVQVGAGIERALTEKWTLITEALYQSEGLSETQNVMAPPNRFMVLSGRTYLLPYATYQVHPLWVLQGGFLANLASDTSYVALAGFEHSLSDDTQLTFKVKWPFGSARGEFGEERISDPFGRRLGMDSTAILLLQSTY